MIGERLYGKYGKEKHLDILQKEYSGKKQKEGSEHYRKIQRGESERCQVQSTS